MDDATAAGKLITSIDRALPARASASAELQQLADDDTNAPLSRDLFHESRSVGFANGRSALVVVIAALEIGVKECIADLIPGATWLVREVASPPVVKMLTEYVPRLPARLRFADGVVPPPQRLRDTIRDGIAKRNELSHKGVERIDPKFLKSVTEAVSDVLRLLDYYRGNEWALRYLSLETMTELGIDPAELARRGS